MLELIFSPVFASPRGRSVAVMASPEVIEERCLKRAKTTGRHVPRDVMLDSIEAVSKSLALLSSKVDFVAHILNETTPTLVSCTNVDMSGRWAAVGSKFRRIQGSIDSFPRSISPLYVCPMKPSLFSASSSPYLFALDNGSAYELSVFRKQKGGEEPTLVARSRITKLSKISLFDDDLKLLAGVPASATHFAWAYPDVRGSKITSKSDDNDDVMRDIFALLLVGGFVYVDISGNVCAVNVLSRDARPPIFRTRDEIKDDFFFGSIRSRHDELNMPLTESRIRALASGNHIQFSDRVEPLKRSVDADRTDSRWHPVTLRPLREKGAILFTFIRPRERFWGHGEGTFPHGGFAYLFEDEESDCAFPVASMSYWT